MKLVIIGDTHGQHEALGTLEGDVLIHCGDIEDLFRPSDALREIDDWFGRQRFEHILCIGGNHDRGLEAPARAGIQPFANATLLHDSAVKIGGATFYGSPWVPELKSHAFFADEAQLKRAWARIPASVDVLITHTPPEGILDASRQGWSLGCPYLAQSVADFRPKLHCFGHVHHSAGQQVIGETTYVNASAIRGNKIANPPVLFDLEIG